MVNSKVKTLREIKYNLLVGEEAILKAEYDKVVRPDPHIRITCNLNFDEWLQRFFHKN